jgi:serine/threonine-protein kinase
VALTQAGGDVDPPEASSDRTLAEPARPANGPLRLLAGRYRIVEPIGAGGMSLVWRAHDEVLGRPVAVKVLATRYASDLIFRDRLRAEAKAAALLAHPNVTNVYDFGEEAGPGGSAKPFVVMELVDGVSLSTELKYGPLSWRTALDMAAETAAALSAAHARGLVHRDITPANIMITSAGVKVVDFGISAVMGDRSGGPVVGTPSYLAPERLAGDMGGPPADVYSLGVVLYQALTGDLPWPTQTGAQALGRPDQRNLFGAHRPEPEPLPEIAGLPDGVAGLIARCLASDPAARPASAALARALAKAAGVRVAAIDSAGAPDPQAGEGRFGRRDDRTAALAPAVTPPAPPHLDPRSAGTRILPSTFRPDAVRTQLADEGNTLLADGQPWPERPAARRRAIPVSWAAAALVLVGVLVAGAVALILPTGGGNQATPARGGGAVPPAGQVASGACAVQYAVRSAWDDGATVDLHITNTSDANITGWTLEFELGGGLKVGDAWNGTWRQDGATVTVEAVDYNRVLAPGRPLATSPGANLSGRDVTKDGPPRQFRLNGTICDATT